MKFKIFISSVQKEFAKERKALAEFIRNDVLLSKFFTVFIFEETPAQNRSAQEVYLAEAAGCDVYLGLIGRDYGYEDEGGVSPTEHEYDAAVSHHRCVLAFVKQVSGERNPKEAAFLSKIESERVRRAFHGLKELKTALTASLVRFLEGKGKIQCEPFDAAVGTEATIGDLNESRIRDFIKVARAKRGLKLTEETPVADVLTHFDLMKEDGRIKNAAILLFGSNPQKYFINSEVKCAQFYGDHVEKPMADHQIYQGDVFELADQAIRFVMTHISNWVGTRSSGDTAEVPTKFELPYDAVKEAIVNAVCHRDYTSHESVQVMLFADRLEVWNAGRLPEGLTVEKLKGAHPSLPPNELLALPMYLKGYIEKSGTGTEDMIEKCREWGLRDPVFNEDGDFRVVIWRRTTQETAQETTQETAQENLSDVSRLIVDLIRADATISRRIIAEKIGLSQDGVKYHLNLLKKKIGLRHEGPTKKGRWVIDAGNAKKKGGAK